MPIPRVVKSAEVRREEILAAAYTLFVRHGYDGTTVSMLLDELRLSKGAFYHHFESKEELAQALARRMAAEMARKLSPLLERRDVTPLAKLTGYFGIGAEYKKEHAPMVRAMADIFYREENLRLRARIMAEAVAYVGPLFARILADGKRDGSFVIDDPDETARLFIHLSSYLHEAFGEAWARAATDLDGAVALVRRRLAAYERAVERLLGVAAKSFSTTMDDATIAIFLAPPEVP